ncbi:MAG: DinB family protein [Acidimicrobiales bacterium]
MADNDEQEKDALLHFLEYQRSSVRSIVEGLSEEGWHTSVVPSGWTMAGLVEHLSGAEYHWFQTVVEGIEVDFSADENFVPYDPYAAFVSVLPSAEILRNYREECERSDAVLARTSMSARPKGRHRDNEVPSVRWVVLHMIEETATHSGHLEIARELLDGQTRLGLR